MKKNHCEKYKKAASILLDAAFLCLLNVEEY